MAGFKVSYQRPFQPQIYLSMCKFVLFLRSVKMHGCFSMYAIYCVYDKHHLR